MKISDSAKEILTQIEMVVSQLEDVHYRYPIAKLGNSTLGQHVRHTLEFFLCLQDGLTRGVINYDLRHRDPDLENNPSQALAVISQLKSFVDKTHPDPDLALSFEVSYGRENEKSEVMNTNFNRELAYNIEHAVHHMAIIKIGIHELPLSIQYPEGFGIAASTLRYRREQMHKA